MNGEPKMSGNALRVVRWGGSGLHSHFPDRRSLDASQPHPKPAGQLDTNRRFREIMCACRQLGVSTNDIRISIKGVAIEASRRLGRGSR